MLMSPTRPLAQIGHPRPMSVRCVTCRSGRWLASSLGGRSPLRQVEPPQHFTEARFLPQAIEEWFGRDDPVLHGSFGGASFELIQRLFALAKTRMDKRKIEWIDVTALPPDHLEAVENSTGIVSGSRRTEDGACITTQDRVPGSRFEGSMHQADCLL